MGKVNNFTSKEVPLSSELDIPDFDDPFDSAEDDDEYDESTTGTASTSSSSAANCKE